MAKNDSTQLGPTEEQKKAGAMFGVANAALNAIRELIKKNGVTPKLKKKEKKALAEFDAALANLGLVLESSRSDGADKLLPQGASDALIRHLKSTEQPK